MHALRSQVVKDVENGFQDLAQVGTDHIILYCIYVLLC